MNGFIVHKQTYAGMILPRFIEENLFVKGNATKNVRKHVFAEEASQGGAHPPRSCCSSFCARFVAVVLLLFPLEAHERGINYSSTRVVVAVATFLLVLGVSNEWYPARDSVGCLRQKLQPWYCQTL